MLTSYEYKRLMKKNDVAQNIESSTCIHEKVLAKKVLLSNDGLCFLAITRKYFGKRKNLEDAKSLISQHRKHSSIKKLKASPPSCLSAIRDVSNSYIHSDGRTVEKRKNCPLIFRQRVTNLMKYMSY